MRSRLFYLILLLCIAAPASAQQPDPRTRRADSLMAVPPDSLSAAELQWLQLYYQDRDRAEREAMRRTVAPAFQPDWMILGTILAVVAGFTTYLIVGGPD